MEDPLSAERGWGRECRCRSSGVEKARDTLGGEESTRMDAYLDGWCNGGHSPLGFRVAALPTLFPLILLLQYASFFQPSSISKECNILIPQTTAKIDDGYKENDKEKESAYQFIVAILHNRSPIKCGVSLKSHFVLTHTRPFISDCPL